MFLTHLTNVSSCGPVPKAQGHWPPESTPACNRYSSSDLGDEHSYSRLLRHPSNKISFLLGARFDRFFTPGGCLTFSQQHLLVFPQAGLSWLPSLWSILTSVASRSTVIQCVFHLSPYTRSSYEHSVKTNA